MLDRVARLAIRTPRWSSRLLVICAAAGGSITDRLAGGGFWDNNSESNRAATVLADKYAAGMPNFVILVTAAGGVGSDAAATAEIA